MEGHGEWVGREGQDWQKKSNNKCYNTREEMGCDKKSASLSESGRKRVYVCVCGCVSVRVYGVCVVITSVLNARLHLNVSFDAPAGVTTDRNNVNSY